jgi:hypothetical protein
MGRWVDGWMGGWVGLRNGWMGGFNRVFDSIEPEAHRARRESKTKGGRMGGRRERE